MSEHDWPAVRPFVEWCESLLSEDPEIGAAIDQVGAWVRDSFDELGVIIADEGFVFDALAVLGLMAEIARRREDNRSLRAAEARSILSCASLLGCVLLEHVPAEARS